MAEDYKNVALKLRAAFAIAKDRVGLYSPNRNLLQGEGVLIVNCVFALARVRLFYFKYGGEARFEKVARFFCEAVLFLPPLSLPDGRVPVIMLAKFMREGFLLLRRKLTFGDLLRFIAFGEAANIWFVSGLDGSGFLGGRATPLAWEGGFFLLPVRRGSPSLFQRAVSNSFEHWPKNFGEVFPGISPEKPY